MRLLFELQDLRDYVGAQTVNAMLGLPLPDFPDINAESLAQSPTGLALFVSILKDAAAAMGAQEGSGSGTRSEADYNRGDAGSHAEALRKADKAKPEEWLVADEEPEGEEGSYDPRALGDIVTEGGLEESAGGAGTEDFGGDEYADDDDNEEWP